MSGLSLLHARGLWLLAGAVPIVLLYVLKTRRGRVTVPSTWLWRGAQRDLQARTPFRKLRNDLSLLLELCALALLALGLAGPACRGRSILGRHVAIVVDASASMATVESGTRTRFDEARAAALRIVDGLAVDADAMLILAGRDARVVFPLGRDRAALRAAIQHLAVQGVEGDPAAAVSLAIDRLRPLGGDRRVLLVSDGLAGQAEGLRSGAIPLQLVQVGHAQDNAGIVRMDVRTARQDRQGDTVQAFALVANDGAAARDVYVTARREGETDVVASRRVRIEPHHREPVVLSFPLRAQDVGTGLVVEMSPHDALPIDDTAYGRIPPGAQLPVAFVARADDPWISRAFVSDPDVQFSTTTLGDLAQTPEGALLVFDGLCPTALPPRHDALVFAPPAGRCMDVTVEGAVDAPSITSFVNTDARFRFLTLDGVHVASATPLRLGPSARELVRATDRVLMAHVSTPEQSSTIVGFDVQDTDWPLRVSFVLFVRNVEEIARTHRARAAIGGGHTGEPLRMAVPVGVREVTVRTPDGATRPLTATAGAVVLGETTQPGLYHLAWRGGAATAAVNLLSDVETDLRGPTLRIEGGPPVGDAHTLVRPHEELAPWLALIAAVALLGNYLWLTRRERVAATKVRAVRPT